MSHLPPNKCIHCGVSVADLTNGADGRCSVSGTNHSFPVSENLPPGNWEKRFEEMFVDEISKSTTIKSFIRSVEQAAEDRKDKELEAVLNYLKLTTDSESNPALKREDESYNMALEDVARHCRITNLTK